MNYVSTFVISLSVVLMVATLSLSLKKPLVLPSDVMAAKPALQKKVARKHHHRRRPTVQQAGAGLPAPAVKAADTEAEEAPSRLPKFNELPTAEDALLMPGVPGTTRPDGELEGSPGYHAAPDADR